MAVCFRADWPYVHGEALWICRAVHVVVLCRLVGVVIADSVLAGSMVAGSVVALSEHAWCGEVEAFACAVAGFWLQSLSVRLG